MARAVAAARGMRDRAAGVRSRKHDARRSDEQIDYDGALGEFAWAKLLGVVPPFDYQSVDKGFDLVLLGLRINVKSTRHDTGRLLVRVDLARDADVYALAVIRDENTVCLAGWLTADEALEAGRPFMGDAKTLAVEQKRLRHPGSIWLYARECQLRGELRRVE
jgi:hypothetical protein